MKQLFYFFIFDITDILCKLRLTMTKFECIWPSQDFYFHRSFGKHARIRVFVDLNFLSYNDGYIYN